MMKTSKILNSLFPSLPVLIALGGHAQTPPNPQAAPPTQQNLPAYEVKYLDLHDNKKIYLQGQDKPFTGLALKRYASGKPEFQMEYKDGVQHGNTQVWWENGNPHTLQIFDNGKSHGKTTFWYESGGKKSEAQYFQGMQHGWTLFWYKSGRKKSAQYWDQGTKTGQYQEWFDAGEDGKEPFKLQGQYKDGEKHGVWVYYNQETQKPESEYHMEDGKMRRLRKWDPNGNLIQDFLVKK